MKRVPYDGTGGVPITLGCTPKNVPDARSPVVVCGLAEHCSHCIMAVEGVFA